MKKIVRLAESDLIRLVKRVIKEQNEVDESSFTFGDKVRNKLSGFVGGSTRTEDEERLADDILDKVESGDFEFVNKTDGFVGKGFTIKVNLEDGEYRVSPKKVRLGVEGPHTTSTYVTTPDGERIEISGKGFGSKLIKLIDDSDRSPRFRYPKK